MSLRSIELFEPVMNESGNGLSNITGTIAMARFADPHSATSQFYFNVADNSRALDPSARNWGYTVFGDVICRPGGAAGNQRGAYRLQRRGGFPGCAAGAGDPATQVTIQ